MSVISLPVSKATFPERPTVRDYCLVSCIPMGWDIEVPLLMNSSFPFYREVHSVGIFGALPGRVAKPGLGCGPLPVSAPGTWS